ncbi:MAG: hypothetical protein JWQ72_2552, partial [Polaromonas sp.]|nr:hypothetical protein [Polaromonas sp.]
MADGDALHVTRTKAFSAVEGQKTLESRRKGLLSGISTEAKQADGPFWLRSLKHKRLEARSRSSSLLEHKLLLEFDFRAGFLELFLGSFCICFWKAFLDV